MNQVKITPKDFFLHLGATIALYVSAGALINLCFRIINYYNPDALAGYFYGNALAWPISMLIVLVPTFYLIEWLINKDITKMPEKKDVWIRRWRIYLTLFLAVVLIGGDLIVVINTYLNGEITSRFVYKAIVMLLVGGAIGKYYFFSMYENFRLAKFSRRLNAWFGVIFVIVAIVVGFIVVGSPAKQRALRFDSQRVSDLSSIQWQIINSWQAKGKLPSDLESLKDPISGNIVPNDPENDSPYEYLVKNETTFELCADFSLESQDTKGRGDYYGGYSGGFARDIAVSYPYPGNSQDSWNHGKGRTCFERTIDPEVYPPRKPETL